MNDPGDEHVDATAPALSEIEQLLAEWTDISEVPWDVFLLIQYADGMRSCCRYCALEANGEDGS
jgi:hypothetical protein